MFNKKKQLKIFLKILFENWLGWLLIIISVILLFMIFDTRHVSVSKDILVIFGYFATLYSWMKAVQELFNKELSNWEKSLRAIMYSILTEVIAGMFLILSDNNKLLNDVIDFSQSYKLWAVNIILILLPLGVAKISKK